MMPPFVKALGPVGAWFSDWFINTFIAKYEDLSKAASIEKARPASGCVPPQYPANTRGLLQCLTWGWSGSQMVSSGIQRWRLHIVEWKA